MTDPNPPIPEAMVEIGCLALYVGLNWAALTEAQREVRREDVRRVYRALADSGSVILPREATELLDEFIECALYDAMMEGVRFRGWNRSALDRLLPKVRAMRDAAMTGGTDDGGEPT